MENITLVSALAWVKRGIAKAEPEKLMLEKAQLIDLIHGDGKAEGDEDEGSDAEMEVNEEKNKTDETGEDAPEKEGNIMKGVAVYANPEDDPFITKHADSEDEDEKEDFLLKPDDNLVVSAKIVKDEPGIDVHVYNEANGDWYVHHDYILDSPPLCIAPIRYDPGQSGKGNLLAVGTFDPIIQIWDLDVVNAIEPIVKLGPKPTKTKSKSRAKRDGSAQGHSDAVTALDWNQLCEHVLASGSADQTVILWDLDEARPATVVNFFDDKIGSLQWHPVEQSIFVAGTRAGNAQIIDARNVDPLSNAAWTMNAEIEQLLWDIHNPFCLFATTDDGKLHYLDSRKPGIPVLSVLAHEDGANAVSQSYGVRGLVATVGENELKVWKLTTSDVEPVLNEVYTHSVKMGKIFSVEFCPDAPNTLVVGGEGEEMVRIIELDKFESLCTAFGAIRVDDTPMDD